VYALIFSCELFAELLGSPDLFMMQVEMDAYSLAKKVSTGKKIDKLVLNAYTVVIFKTTSIMGR